MSPSSSSQPPDPHPSRPSQSRPSSIAKAPAPSKPKTPSPAPPPQAKPINYTVIIRLPFPRGEFKDPDPVAWDSAKDLALWKIISKASTSRDLDWEDIAQRFEVGLAFLMQQAAWLYERHFEGVRTQMRRLAEGGGGGEGRGSRGGLRRESPMLVGGSAEASVSGSPGKAQVPGFERTPSSATLTQSRIVSGVGLRQRALRSSGGSQQRRPPVGSRRAVGAEDEDATIDSNESDDEPGPAMARSQAFRRPPGAGSSRPALATLSSEGDASGDDDEEEDPESSSGYLPFAAAAAPGRETTDPAATIRGSPKRTAATTVQPVRQRAPEQRHHDSSASSSSSAAQNPPNARANPDTTQWPGPISPQHRAQLAHLSPRQQRQAARAEGSEGTPSMGSSFSDLEDASVAQSALEEALMSNLQRGGTSQAGSIASRVSGLGRAWGGNR